MDETDVAIKRVSAKIDRSYSRWPTNVIDSLRHQRDAYASSDEPYDRVELAQFAEFVDRDVGAP